MANYDSNSISVVDISNPITPVEIATTSVGSYPTSVTISGRYAYVTNQSGSSISIIDISSPAAPVEIATASVGSNPTSIAVSGRYAYVANGSSNSISVVDLQGVETNALFASSLEAGNIQIQNDLTMQGNLNVGASLVVGPGGLLSQGALAVSSVLPSYIAGNLGLGTTSPNYALDVYASTTGVIARFNNSTNNTNCTLTSSGGTISCTSDERLKKNISQLNYGLADLIKIQPVAFNWNSDNNGVTSTLGFIAQDVEKVFPQLVTTDEISGYKSLSQVGMIPVMVNAIKEIGSFIAKIENGVAYLTNVVIDGLTATVALFNSVETNKLKVKDGIEMIDKVTGSVNCIQIANGEIIKTLGDCQSVSSPVIEPVIINNPDSLPPLMPVTGNLGDNTATPTTTESLVFTDLSTTTPVVEESHGTTTDLVIIEPVIVPEEASTSELIITEPALDASINQ